MPFNLKILSGPPLSDRQIESIAAEIEQGVIDFLKQNNGRGDGTGAGIKDGGYGDTRAALGDGRSSADTPGLPEQMGHPWKTA
jgi:hypothetical protein